MAIRLSSRRQQKAMLLVAAAATTFVLTSFVTDAVAAERRANPTCYILCVLARGTSYYKSGKDKTGKTIRMLCTYSDCAWVKIAWNEQRIMCNYHCVKVGS